MSRAQGAGLRIVRDDSRAAAAMWREHARAPTPDTRFALFETYRSFAIGIALRALRRTGDTAIDRAECIQLALEALLQSIDRFDPRRETHFEGFLRPRVRGHVHNALARASEAGAYFSWRRRAERDRVRSLKDADTSSDATAIDQLSAITAKLALGFMLESSAQTTLEDIPDSAPSALDTLAFHQTMSELDRRLDQLPQREAFVLVQHYRQGLQFTQIAVLLGLTKGRISQLHSQGLTRLRKQMVRVV